MNRARKQEVVIDFKDMFTQAEATFVVEYQGVDVVALQKLRRELRGKNASLRITKARLMKKALQDMPETVSFLQDLKQQIGLVFVNGEAPAVAKALVDFSKEKQELKIVSGFFEKERIDASRVAFLAALPSREGAIAQVAGAINEIIARIPRAIKMANEKRSLGEVVSEAVVE